MNYRIEKKAAFTVVGVCRRFNSETSYVEVPRFWDEYFKCGGDPVMKGMFGVCLDGDGDNFDYLIADLYLPWDKIPDGCITRTVPEATWAVFPYHGQCPEALQEVNTMAWCQWLPNSDKYELAGNFSLEYYISDIDGEIWIPVKEK